MWFARGVRVKLRPAKITAMDGGFWRSTTGLANTATAAVKRTEAITKQCIIAGRVKEVCTGVRHSGYVEGFIYFDPDYTDATKSRYKCLSQMDKDPEDKTGMICLCGS